MVNKLERASLLAMGEAQQRMMRDRVASGQIEAPEPRRLGKASNRGKVEGAPDHKNTVQTHEEHWSEWPWQKQVKIARELYGHDNAVDVIPTANAARAFLADHNGEPLAAYFPELAEQLAAEG